MNEPRAYEIAAETVGLVLRKNRAYGSKNIEMTGVQGVAVRVMDKASRLLNLANDPTIDTGDESIRDTFRDLMGYGLIGQMLLEGSFAETIRNTADQGQAEAEDCVLNEEPLTIQVVNEYEKLQIKQELEQARKLEAEKARAEREAMEQQKAEEDRAKARDWMGYQHWTPTPRTVYLCGPIDHVSHEDAREWRLYMAGKLDDVGVMTFNPAAAVTGGNHDKEAAVAICRTVIDIADIVLAYLPGNTNMLGSIMEIEHARALGKPVVVVSEWAHRSIFSFGLHLVPNFDEAMKAISEIVHRLDIEDRSARGAWDTIGLEEAMAGSRDY